MQAPEIGIVGSGKVAQMLLRLAKQAQIPIAGIYARNFSKSQALADKYQSRAFEQLQDLCPQLLLICISDDALPEIISKLAPRQVAAYTAGSPSIKLFSHPQLGVCYPFQSISKGRDLPATEIPFMIEGKNDLVIQRISAFLNALGAQYQQCGSAQRAHYHLAGVFVNNFGNLMLLEASKILNEAQLDMSPLYPLLNETIAKAILLGAENAQTGPALRHDQNTLDRHRAQLDPAQLIVYDCLTQRIQDLFQHD